MQPDSSPPSLLLPLADGRLQLDGSSSSRSASATCLGGSRRVARRFRRSAIAAAACRCLPRRFPTRPSISSGAPLEGLGSNPGVEDHLLGHGNHRRHRDRRHRRTAGAPPLHRRTAGGPRVRCLFFRYVRSLFGQRLLIFLTRVLILLRWTCPVCAASSKLGRGRFSVRLCLLIFDRV